MSEFRTRSSSNHSAVKRAVWAFALLWGSWLTGKEPAADTADIRINSPCSESESWKMSPKFQKSLPPEIRGFLKGLTTQPDAAVRAFSDSFTFRQRSKKHDTSAVLADYAIARSLHHALIFGLAAELFDRIIQEPTSPNKAPIQIAAISCLGQIHRRYSAFGFSPAAIARVPDFFKKGQPNKRELNILWYATTENFLLQLKAYDKANAGKEKAKLAKAIKSTIDRLKPSPPHEAFARGLWAIHQQKTKEATVHLAKFVQSDGLVEALDSKRDAARLLLARAYYELEDYKNAIIQLELVDKRANELVHTLNYLGSAQLLVEDYPKAIGASLGLQSGRLKETFAPEALMVTAMALNELCHFPESLAMLNKFRRQYQATFFWLKDHAAGGKKESEVLYPLALAFLKEEAPPPTAEQLDEFGEKIEVAPTEKGKVALPSRVGSEWIRSPIFISKQESINHLFRTMRKIPKMISLGKTVHKIEIGAIRTAKTELKEAYQKARAALKPGEKIPQSIQDEVVAMRVREARQARLQYSLPHFARALNGYQQRAQQWQAYLTSQIEGELKRLNSRMYTELVSVMENNELVEAEIWNGASQDIVWQNAHPEFQEMVKSGKLDSGRTVANSAEIYDWGNSNQGLDGTEEVWEDEIGAIQANMQNNCTNKEKYMKLQQRRR